MKLLRAERGPKKLSSVSVPSAQDVGQRKVTPLPVWGSVAFLTAFLMSEHQVNRFLIPNRSHSPTQDQSHTFAEEEEIFGRPGISA